MVMLEVSRRAAVGDGGGLAALYLVDRAVLGHEEAALGDVPLSRRGVNGTGTPSPFGLSVSWDAAGAASRAIAVRRRVDRSPLPKTP